MFRGLYSAASGMLVESMRLDTAANNLANASTAGFKRDTAVVGSFQQLLLERMNDRPGAVGTAGTGAFVAQVAARLTSGTLRPTGNSLDVAILGDGFFSVQTPHGIRYTRNGSFVRDAQGRLATPEGYLVLAGGQPVGELGQDLALNDAGEVLLDGEAVAALDIASGRSLGALAKEGEGIWALAPGRSQLILPLQSEVGGEAPYQLRTGFLEAANVDPVAEMVTMIATLRAYEANQKAIQAHDETAARAVNLGR